jgi:ubiquinone biosynthesis protein COQ9
LSDDVVALIALREEERRRLMRASLAEVPFDGWSRRSLAAGAAAADMVEADVDRLFPRGPVEMIEFWNVEADRAVEVAFAAVDPVAMRVRERVAFGVRARLDYAERDVEAVRRALAVLALPANAALGSTLLWRTADTIWWCAGDTATDWNFYSKRGLLCGVYATTLLYWLDDRSPGREATWAFLDRRIADVMALPKAIGRLRERARAMIGPLAGLGAARR